MSDWRPHPGQQTFALSVPNAKELLYGGARGGGKTDAGMAWMLQPIDHPRYRGLVVRKNSDDLADWVDRAQMMYTRVGGRKVGNPPEFHFPSGARFRTGHLKDENAYTKYQGHEYHRILTEELTQIPREEDYLKLISSCRSTQKGLVPRVFCTANPGGAGHAWVKKRWRTSGRFKHLWNKVMQTKDGNRIYIPATIHDNPTLLQNDPAYLRYLESLPEPLRTAWLMGDWDIFAGQYFQEYNPHVHLISAQDAAALGYGYHWNTRTMGIDWGFKAPFAALWLETTIVQGKRPRVFFDRELYGTEVRPGDWGRRIAEVNRTAGWRVQSAFGDPSMWIRNPHAFSDHTESYSDASIADAIRDGGLPQLVPGNNSRISGWQFMASLMQVDNLGESSFYIIKGTCPNLARTIPEMIHDEKKVEDIDTTLEDHAPDAARYGLSHLAVPTKPEEPVPALQREFEELTSRKDPVERGYEWQ